MFKLPLCWPNCTSVDQITSPKTGNCYKTLLCLWKCGKCCHELWKPHLCFWKPHLCFWVVKTLPMSYKTHLCLWKLFLCWQNGYETIEIHLCLWKLYLCWEKLPKHIDDPDIVPVSWKWLRKWWDELKQLKWVTKALEIPWNTLKTIKEPIQTIERVETTSNKVWVCENYWSTWDYFYEATNCYFDRGNKLLPR